VLFQQNILSIRAQHFINQPVSLAQLGERQTEVSVTKSGGIVFDPRRGHSSCSACWDNSKYLFAHAWCRYVVIESRKSAFWLMSVAPVLAESGREITTALSVSQEHRSALTQSKS
jgi:hypothetical protein